MRYCKALIVVLVMFSMAAPARAAQTPTGALALSDCLFGVGTGAGRHIVPAKCGVLLVLENPALPQGRTIYLRVTVLPALDSNAKGLPIFHLEGGPGLSAIRNFGSVWYDAFAEARKTHPIVLIDQRGTGSSNPLTCTEISSQYDADLGKALSPQEEQANELARFDACFDRLIHQADLRFYNSNQLADDTDAVRAALDYDQIALFGNSYGTSLAQVYLARHGDHVAGAVLDSVTGPWNYPFLDAPNDAQASLNKVFAQCAADALCNKKYPRLDAQLKKILDGLAAKPKTVIVPDLLTKQQRKVIITPKRVETLLFGLLYTTAGITELPQIISRMTAGNFTSIASSLAQSGGDGGLARGMYMSVACAEYAPFYTDAVIRTHPQNSLFDVSDLKRLCTIWPSAALTAADIAPVRSNRPVLILSGGFDPITPVRFGTETRSRFPRSSLVVFANQGHGILPGSKCAQTIVLAFFADPAKAVDGTCAAKDLKPLFAGAYSVDFAPFSRDDASFAGKIPSGWKTEQDDAITFMQSPDGLQFAGAGIYRFQKPEIVIDALLAQIKTRFGAVDIKERQTASAASTSVVTLLFALDRPDQVYYGAIVLQTRGNNTYAFWQAAPINWFNAAVTGIAPQMIIAMREPN